MQPRANNTCQGKREQREHRFQGTLSHTQQSNTVLPGMIMGHLKHNLKLPMTHLTRRREGAPSSSAEAVAQNDKEKTEGGRARRQATITALTHLTCSS